MEKLKSGFEFIFSSYKRTAAILFIAALTLAIPITITLVGQQQDIRQRAATNPPLIPGCGSLGDVNGDGKINSVDSSLILQYEAGLIPISGIIAANSDVNKDGKINSIDSSLILQYEAGLISTFSACSTRTPTTPPSATNTPTPIRTPAPTTPPQVTGTSCDSAACGKYGAICCPGSSSCIAWWQDNSNCGACGNKCSAGTTCQLNVPGNYTQGASCKSTGGQTSPTPTRAPTPTVPSSSLIPGCGSLGDVNGDGKINSVDQLLIQQYVAGLIPLSGLIAANADVNRDGKINSVDQLLIQQYSAGLISTFPGCSSSPTPTPTPTRTTAPTGIPPGATGISISITLPGIGVSQNPALGINNNPKRPQRDVEVTIINSGNQKIDLTKSTVNYDRATGKYKGNVNLGSSFASGSYLVKVRLDNTLWKTIPGIQNITSGQTYNTPEATLVSGDIIRDNEINLLDYNALISCIRTQACATKAQADLNDDDKVEELDLNILYAGFAKRKGD